MTKYILRQHISSPQCNCDAGAIGEEREGKVWFDGARFFYDVQTVIANPHWFKRIDDTEESSKPFVWTRELVEEFVWDTYGHADVRYQLDKFIKEQPDKSQTISAGKGTANDVQNTEGKYSKAIDELKNITSGVWDKANTNEEINEHLGREGKDWEIVAIKHRGEIIDVGDPIFSAAFKTNFEKNIWSVKRLSDGEIFTVGDFIKVNDGGKSRKGWSDPIEKFIINGDTMVAQFPTWRQPLKDLERMHKDIRVTDTTQKDWEIVKSHATHGVDGWPIVIDSVKRLSDGEVFSVGDELRDHDRRTIEKFIIDENGDMIVSCNLYSFKLKHVVHKEKPQPQQESRVLYSRLTKPDWSIVEFRTKYMGHENVAFTRGSDGQFRTGLNGKTYIEPIFDLLKKATIWSVKRSDGEVFSVGSDAETNNGRGVHKISEFKIIDGDMCVGMETFPTRYEFLSKVSKPQPKQESKDWQILSYKSKSGRIFLADEVADIGIEDVEIYTVKRLSDGVPFSVGEDVVRDGVKDKIYAFKASEWNDKMKVGFRGAETIGWFWFEDISKPKPHHEHKRIDIWTAIIRIAEELSEDQAYYYTWQSSIAVCFQDKYREELGDSEKMRCIIHEISNEAAKQFLNQFINKKS